MKPQTHPRYLVEVQQRSEARDTVGQPKEIWTTVRREWAMIEPLSGREYYDASSERATITHRVTLPLAAAVRPRDRIKYGASIFDVKSAIRMADNRRMILMCLEFV